MTYRNDEIDRETGTGTHLLPAVDKLVAPFFWEIFLHQKLLAALQIRLSLVFLLRWNTIQDIILIDVTAGRQHCRRVGHSHERPSSFPRDPSSSRVRRR